jgi:N4-gp56 family major capsid protein
MATTNFGLLSPNEVKVWERDLFEEARNMSYWTRFSGDNGMSPIHRFTNLTKDSRGTKAVFQLVADLTGDGIVGDAEREGNEEKMVNQFQVVQIDLMSHSVRSEGEMAEQESVIDFRKTAKNKLAFWYSDRRDRILFNVASGISLTRLPDGSLVDASSNIPRLSFANDVSAPSTKRSLMFNGTALVASNTASITSSYLPSYDMLTMLKAYAKTHYIKPIRSGGKEYYILLVRPETIAVLKRDASFKQALSGVDPKSNPIFTGAIGELGGFIIHEHNYVYNTTGLTSGSKWGSGGVVEGTRSLVLGAQALGLCEIGSPKWTEKMFDYDSKAGINVSQIFGVIKPKFSNIYEKTVEDFGVLTVDHFLPQ